MALADSLPCILFTFTGALGHGCKLCYCNHNLVDLFGIETADLIEESRLPFTKLSDLDQLRITELLQELIQGQHPTVTARFCIPHNQQNHWFELHASPEDSESPLTIEHQPTSPHATKFQATIYQITQQYAEQQRTLESAGFFLNILDQLPDRFYYKDAQSRYQGGNKAWREFRGIANMAQWIGKTDLDSTEFDHEFSQRLFNEEQEMLRTGMPIRSRETLEHRDGRVTYSDSIKSPLYDSNKKVIGLVGLTRDITEQVKIEQALAQAKMAAEAAVKAKSAFLAIMSHEIRTPMNGVIGCASLLTDTPLNEEQQQLVHTIQSCGEGLLVIINDILDYSKIEADQFSLDSHSFHLRELVEDTFDLFCKSADDKDIEINYYLEPEIPLMLISDSSRIRQVLINLLGNAIKFTQQGEVTLCATLHAVNKKEHTCSIRFEVNDSGIGIPESSKASLFEAFTQADASTTRKFGGTGLGLAICKKIVTALGGDIGFNSQEGKGSSFFFTLPLSYSPHSGNHQSLDTSLLKGFNALIVDDNATNRKILSTTLKYWGMECTSFSSPENALENFSLGHKYDIAILDQCMPSIQGTELAQHLQNIDPRHPIPVIILSSAAERISLANSTFQYLQKPAHNSQLIRTLFRLLKLGTQQLPIAHTNTTTIKKEMRILIVEDNAVNQMVISKMLAKLGYQKVTAVADGTEAVDICKKMEVDVILMDVQMRHMDGYTATRKIRAHKKHSFYPWIIALTAGVQKEDAERALACGMNDFATKPIQLEQIRELLEKAEAQMPISKPKL